MATPNLFAGLTTVKAKTAGTAKKPEKAKTFVEGLEVYAAIDHTVKWLKSVQETFKETINSTVIVKFIDDGIAARKAPASFNGEEGASKANLQLRKRSANSALTEMEQEVLAKYGIPTETVADRPETIIINPDHLAWVIENSGKLSAVIAKAFPKAPADLFQKQEATTKVVVADDTLDYVFATFGKKRSVIEEVLPIVSTPAIKPQFLADPEDANEKALAIINAALAA